MELVGKSARRQPSLGSKPLAQRLLVDLSQSDKGLEEMLPFKGSLG